MHTQIEQITPEIAKLYLQHNKVNRALKGLEIATLVRDIQGGAV